MTSSHHAPYVQGYTRATLAHTEGCKTARWSESLKVRLGSDCRLKFACMKAELLVIADQHCRGEYVPGPCTHRPSHHGSWFDLKLVRELARDAANHGRVSDWGEVVTR